jgi:hypothetical protein
MTNCLVQVWMGRTDFEFCFVSVGGRVKQVVEGEGESLPLPGQINSSDMMNQRKEESNDSKNGVIADWIGLGRGGAKERKEGGVVEI